MQLVGTTLRSVDLAPNRSKALKVFPVIAFQDGIETVSESETSIQVSIC